jgi:NADP-dependent 3-hydroxy acid dehydrogenase YdfG
MSKKQYALVTGGTRGIGQAIALKLLEEGFGVFYTGTTVKSIKATAEVFKSYKEQAIALVCDVTDENNISALLTRITETTKSLDILVNNAGVFVSDGFSSGNADTVRNLLEVNVLGTYNISQAMLPLMRKAKRAHIFNICSVAGLNAYPNGCSYSISKFALDGLGKSMRLELKDQGIRVTQVYPGATYTDSWSNSDLPESRFMQTTDVAKSIFNAYDINLNSNVEEIVIRPILGDI